MIQTPDFKTAGCCDPQLQGALDHVDSQENDGYDLHRGSRTLTEVRPELEHATHMQQSLIP